jgi:predicted transposase/invertase (TIGR01784 family)
MITDKYIDPFTDFGFKHIFGTEENKRFLISFLNDLLEIEDKIVDIEYRNLEKLELNIVDRKAIFDVYCTDTKGNNFIVELQRSRQEYFRDRSVYYTTFPIQEQSKKGFWDYRLKKIYFIGILEFKMDINDDSDEYITKVQLCNTKTKDIFYDKLTYIYLEMPKFKKKESELSNHLEYWLWYLNNLANTQKIPPRLKEDKLIKEAFDVAEFLALDKDRQFAYQLNLKARLDYTNVMNYAKKEARKEGIEEGIKEGIKTRNIEIAKTSLKQNIDINTIAMITDLTIEEIERLKNQIEERG